MRVQSAPVPRSDRTLLLAFGIFTAGAVLGYGLFGRHPGIIPDWQWARDFYRVSFQFFGQLHAGLAAGVLIVVLMRHSGLSWTGAAAGVYVLALGAEYLGTRTGLPFGPYRYSGLMGPKIADLVPVLIPLSWFVMAVPAYRIASALWEGPGRLARLSGATALLVAWDLALDPAMSALTPYWIWEVDGAYYGMPMINLVGWAATGMLIMTLLEVTGARRWTTGIPLAWAAAFYGLVLALPLGMLIASAAWLAVGCTATAVLAIVAQGYFRHPLRREAGT